MKKITLFLMLITAFVSAQNSKVARSTTGSSSIESASNSFQMKGTLGQITVGASAGSEATVASGYWGWITKKTSLDTEKEEIIPSVFKVQPAYPNPFNPTTKIDFAIPEDNKVLLEVYDINGRKISTLIDKNIQKGYHSIVWNGSDYSSGVYFIRMASGGYVSTNKVVLVK